MRKANRLTLEELAPTLLTIAESPALLDWSCIFGNPGPVEIEVGCGKGLFLLTESQARPHVNFVGIEIVRKYQLFAATRLAKRRIGNVRLACADAREFLKASVPAGSVQAVHVYFPDPWWKRRHKKRRVFTPEFVVECQRVLCGGGSLQIATDVPEYFDFITELVATSTDLHSTSPDDSGLLGRGVEYLTNFERKARMEGKPIYRGVFQKLRELIKL